MADAPFLTIDDSFLEIWPSATRRYHPVPVLNPTDDLVIGDYAQRTNDLVTEDTPIDVLFDDSGPLEEPESPVAQVSSELERRLHRAYIHAKRNETIMVDQARELQSLLKLVRAWSSRAGGPTQPAGTSLVGLARSQNQTRAPRSTPLTRMNVLMTEVMTPTPVGEVHVASLHPPSLVISDEAAARFWRRVVRTPEHWIWRGGVNKNSGRGITRIGDKVLYAHRVAFSLHTGRDITGELLSNACGEYLCVQPQHHRLGAFGTTTDRDLYAEDPLFIDVPPAPKHYSVSTDAARTMDVAKHPDGTTRRCRKNHALTYQPGGRATCRACDRERHHKSLAKKAAATHIDARTTLARTELSRALDAVQPEPVESPDDLFEALLKIEAGKAAR